MARPIRNCERIKTVRVKKPGNVIYVYGKKVIYDPEKSTIKSSHQGFWAKSCQALMSSFLPVLKDPLAHRRLLLYQIFWLNPMRKSLVAILAC